MTVQTDIRYDKTIRASFTGYIIQAIVDLYAALLFVQFQREFGISLARITLLVTINFLIQLAADVLSVRLIDRAGYRVVVVSAQCLVAAGLGLMAVLPGHWANPFAALMTAVVVCSSGGGLLEVVLSPIVEACPTPSKDKTMSQLHAFYSFGLVIVIAGSNLFFLLFGIANWRILTALWMILPLANAVRFLFVPFASLIDEGSEGMSVRELLKNRLFWCFFIMMLCAGAADEMITQWGSALAESALGVSKIIGDLAGPLLFAVMMGLTRLMYGRFGHRFDLRRYIAACAGLNFAAMLMIAFFSHPAVVFIGCALCGVSVSAMWPGTLSLASSSLRRGGNALFALLALGGDIGCSAGPSLAGFAASARGNDLQAGIAAAAVFPAALFILVLLSRRHISGGDS